MPRADWRLRAHSSWFHIRARDDLYAVGGQEFIGSTPGLQVSLRSSLDITPGLQWDVWLRHVGKLAGSSDPIDDVPAYTSLDMRLAWKPNRALEIALVGQNLLDAGHQEIVMTNILSAPVKIERGVYLKMDWTF